MLFANNKANNDIIKRIGSNIGGLIAV